MYRARAEAVSGKMVFADGKWLTCIGNKIVHDGDYIWTDGRCVYGIQQAAQQPLIIPTQEEKIIPIVTTSGNYIFDKSKLKPCKTESPLSGEKGFVNNTHRKLCSVDDYLFLPVAYSFFTRNEDQIRTAAGTFLGNYYSEGFSSNLKGIIAANVDDSGNLFLIIIDGTTLFIKKNKDIIREIDLTSLAENFDTEVPQPSPVAEPPIDQSTFVVAEAPIGAIIRLTNHLPLRTVEFINSGIGPDDIGIFHCFFTTVELRVKYAFITNENIWAVYLVFYFTKSSELYVGEWYGDKIQLTSINCYLTNNDTSSNVGDTAYIESKDLAPEEADAIFKIFDVPDPAQKLPLQNGYYFTEESAAKTVIDEDDGHAIFYNLVKRTIYSADGRKLVAGIFDATSEIIAFAVIKGRYLLNVWNNRSHFLNEEHVKSLFDDDPNYFQFGLYFFNKNKWTLLSKDKCYNLRFRPMQKVLNWQNRIKEFSLE